MRLETVKREFDNADRDFADSSWRTKAFETFVTMVRQLACQVSDIFRKDFVLDLRTKRGKAKSVCVYSVATYSQNMFYTHTRSSKCQNYVSIDNNMTSELKDCSKLQLTSAC